MLLPAPIPIGNLAVKHPEVPLLPDYSVNPPSFFWESFPVRTLPPSSVSLVNAQALLHRLLNAPGLTAAQLACGRLSVQELTHGASACQLSPPLPPFIARNTPAAVTHGQQVTDNVVGWIKATSLLVLSRLHLSRTFVATLSLPFLSPVKCESS